MQEIAENVYIEDQYPGVTLAAISLPQGLIQLDSPPSPEDSRSWRATLLNLGSGVERVLVNLDSHPDRAIGARGMDCTIIAHERTAQAFRNRPSTFKAQNEDTGADWETILGIGSIRWAPPEISFSKQLTFEWSNTTVQLELHAGPTSGATWVVLPAEKVIFVGDLVVKNQPPFLYNGNLDKWIAELEILLSPAYRNHTVVSGRGGVVSQEEIKAQLKLISDVKKKLAGLAEKKSAADATEALVQNLLTQIKSPAEKMKQHTQRLRYGLRQCYIRNFHVNGANLPEEE